MRTTRWVPSMISLPMWRCAVIAVAKLIFVAAEFEALDRVEKNVSSARTFARRHARQLAAIP